MTALIADLASDDERVRRVAGEALVPMGHGPVLDRARTGDGEELARALDSCGAPVERILLNALEDLRQLRQDIRDPKLSVAFTRDELHVRGMRASALERLLLGAPGRLTGAVSRLGELLHDPSGDMRGVAGEILVGLGEGAVPATEDLYRAVVEASDRTPGLLPAGSIVRALAQLCREDKALLLRMGELLRSPDPNTVSAGAYALEHVGPSAAPLVDALIVAAQDAYAGGNAIDALAAIAPDDARVTEAIASIWTMTTRGDWRRVRIVIAARVFPSQRATFDPLLRVAAADDAWADEDRSLGDYATATIAILDAGEKG